MAYAYIDKATWKCVDCGGPKSPYQRYPRLGRCGACYQKYHLRKNPGYRNRQQAASRVTQARIRSRDRAFVFSNLGGRCACCGYSDARFLTLDHIKGDGAADRVMKGGRSSHDSYGLYRRIRQSGSVDTARYQLLCYNCNCAKRSKPRCPHQQDREDAINSATSDAQRGVYIAYYARPRADAQTQTLRERYAAFR